MYATSAHYRSPILQNPVWDLHAAHQSEILRTRTALVAELRSVSAELGSAAEGVLKRKVSAQGFPSLGEMLPWILGDLVGTNTERLRGVALGWLGLYTYGILIDDAADAQRGLTSVEQLSSAMLLSIGFREFYRVVNGTRYEEQFSRELAAAVRYQLCDIEQQKQAVSEDREQYTIGKNSSLLCGAIGVAAVCGENGERIIEFIVALRLPLQLLDDLGDWQEDASANNYTLLLSDLTQHVQHDDSRPLDCIPPAEMIQLLISSGSLVRALSRTDRVLSGVLGSVGATEGATNRNATLTFFLRLKEEIQQVIVRVGEAQTKLAESAEAERNAIGDDIQQALKIVAQGT
jgi:hypothetical protein